MKVIIVTALIAVCSSANLNRSYLPPASAKTAGGSSSILQTPNLELPVGSYENEHQGVVVDAGVGTRNSSPGQSGLGASRPSYGSTNSKVGEAAFRDKHLQGGPSFLPQGFVDFKRPERVQAMRDRVSNIIRIENNLSPESYNYLYQTDNGISAGEKAIAVNGVRAEGGYSYTGDDGQVYTVTYTADEDGYKPKGDHLPTPPPIPAEILKALEQNAKDEAAGLIDDGSYDAQKYNTGGDYSESSDNDRYNDRQSNKFANRPGFNVPSSFFNNQYNQELKPNFSPQPALISNKDAPNHINIQTTFTHFRPESILPQDNLSNRKPDVFQDSFFTANRIGESKPSQNSLNKEHSVNQLFAEQTTLTTGNDDNLAPLQETGIPLFQQSLQNKDDKQNFQTSSKPSSYDTSSKIQGSISNINIQETDATQLNIGGNRLTTVLSESRPTASILNNFENFNDPIKGTNSLDSISSQQIIFPTNQPSKELTTPFETNFTSNLDSDHKPVNTFSPALGTATDNLSTIPPRFQDFIKKPQNNGLQSDLTNKFKEDIGNKPSALSTSGTNSQKPFQEFNDNLNVNIKPSEQSIPIQHAYEGEIYQYNKPTFPQSSSNVQGFGQSSTPTNIISQNPDNKQQISTAQGKPSSQSFGNSEIYEYNKPNSGPIISQNFNHQGFNKQTQSISNQSTNKPTSQEPFGLQSISQKPLQASVNKENLNNIPQISNQQDILTNTGEIYEYNKPTSSFSVVSTQQPSNNKFIQSQLNNPVSQMQNYNQFSVPPLTTGSFINPSSQNPVFHGSQSSFSQVKPTIATIPNVFSSTLGQSYNTQTNAFNTQTSHSSEYFNSRPPTSFLQSRPTVSSLGQATTNQPRQPQGPDGSYNYDRPLKPLQQQLPSSFNQNRITQRPQFSTNTEFSKPTSQLILPQVSTVQLPMSFHNNGITQASVSSFAPNSITSSVNQQSNIPFNSRPGSTFAQASASTRPFPTTPSLKPQAQMPVQQSHSNTYEGEIYHYNKPEESSAKPEKTEQKIETAPINAQLKPQSILSLDSKGSTVENFNFQPVSSPQNIPFKPHSFEGAETPQESTFESQKPAPGDSRPIGSTILGSPCCSHLQQHGLSKPEPNRNQLNTQSLTPQETSSIIKGEQFDVNRKPSTFDSTGYHY